MSVIVICYEKDLGQFFGQLIGSAQIDAGSIISGKIASGAVPDICIASGITADKLHSGYAGFKVASGYPSVGLTGLILPNRVSGLPYANLALSGRLANTDILSGITADKLHSGYAGFKVASGYPVEGLTGFLPFARLSGLPFSNLYSEIQSFTNILFNGDFEVGDPPKGWGFWGDGGTRERSTEQVKIGTYSAKITVTGTYSYMEYEITGYAYYKSRSVTLGCWVYATVANRARLYMTDGIGNSFSSYHTGGSSWEWLTVTRTISASATGLWIEIGISNGATSAYYDGAILVEGNSCPAFMPRPLDYQSVLSGYLGSGVIATPHIRPQGILSASIGANIIATPHIQNQGILSASIGTNVIATPHIQNQGILSGSIGSGQIGISHLAAGAAKVVAGSYTGNAADSRQITTGFACKLVILLHPVATLTAWMCISTSTAIKFTETSYTDIDAQDLLLHATDGFIVNNDYANQSVHTYYYVAIG